MPPISAQSRTNILVVDDTPANLRLLAGMLKDHGYRVRPVTSGEMALRAIEAQAPDLILLDINMPGMNGYEVCRRIKASEYWRDIPVLFISALNDTEDKIKAFQAGGVDYVSKPFQFEEVDARVRTHLELRRQKLQLQQNFASLQELESMRDSLTHMIAHDMRSPLMAIQLTMELIEEAIPAKNGESRQLLINARQSTAQLIELVSQMLDISRMEAGKLELHYKETDLITIAKEALALLKALALDKKLTSHMPAPLPISADPDLIRRVISNLLGNALKFTRQGGEVNINVTGDATTTRVEGTDSGCGIAPEHHATIFEKFGQIGLKAKIAGSGLGLTFSKMVIEAHGGRIGVISAPGQGSTFWFTLPKNKSQPQDKCP